MIKMYQKIVCKNGIVTIYTDLGEKIQTMKNINIIRIAEIDNLVEQIDVKTETVQKEIKFEKKTTNKLLAGGIMAICISLNFLLNPMFDIPYFYIINSLIGTIVPVSFLLCITCYIKFINKILNSKNMVLDFLKNKRNNLLKEKEKLLNEPCFDCIRENQEFMLKDGSSIRVTAGYLESIYNTENLLVHLLKGRETKDDISQTLITGFYKEQIDWDSHEDILNEVCKLMMRKREIKK